MTKSLYYIKCECIKPVRFPHRLFQVGDVVYFNSNVSSNEMRLSIWGMDEILGKEPATVKDTVKDNVCRYRYLGSRFYLPFTKSKTHAKKWQIKRYPLHIVSCIESRGDFKCTICEIKINYTEEEI